MATHAPVGRLAPELGPAEPVEIAAVPTPPEADRSWVAALLPALSGLGLLAFAVMSPSPLVIGICVTLTVVTVVAAVLSTRSARRRREGQWRAQADRYRGHLEQCRLTLAEAQIRQAQHAYAIHPAPEPGLPAAGLVRHGTGALQVRLGVGRVRSRRAPQVRPPSPDVAPDPGLLAEATELAAWFAAVDGVPVTVPLAGGQLMVLSGTGRPLLRAMIYDLVRSYAPRELRLYALASAAETRWLEQLPHASCVTSSPAELRSAVRRLGAGQASSSFAVAPFAAAARDIIVLDTPDPAAVLEGVAAPLERADVAVIALVPDDSAVPSRANAVIRPDDDASITVTVLGADPSRLTVPDPDRLAYPAAVRLAQGLSARDGDRPGSARHDRCLEELLEQHPPDPLVLPIGQLADSAVVVTIDLREAAHGGDGPHGLIIGATGSGKSELMRAVIAAGAHQSPPDELALVLIDYKGGAAFAEFADLPHTAGLLTNLSDDPLAIDRLCASLRAEVKRRQQLLRAAGADDLEAYHRRASDSAPLPSVALPRLLIVVDEYAELIEQSPEVLDVLTSIGRLGRSLGMHLLLSSQRLDDGRLRGLDAHLRLRVCLRTLAAADSLAVLGSAAAAELPSRPGLAYVRRDGALDLVRVAAVSSPAAAARAIRARHAGAADGGYAQHQILRAPLPTELTLDRLADLEQDVRWARGALRAVVGVLDVPDQGEQRPLSLDLAERSAHLAVIGAPRSGRSTTLATAVVALADATPARDLSIHVITAATSVLAGVAGLPHVGTVATTDDLAGQVVRTVAAEVTSRQETGQGRLPHLLLVVDDVYALLRSHDDLATEVAAIAHRGLSVGVTLLVSCSRWTDLRSGLRDLFGRAWELTLNDSSDSMQPQRSRRLPRPPAGRVLTESGHWGQIALPRTDGRLDTTELAEALAAYVAGIARRGGTPTRPVQLLPLCVPVTKLPAPSAPGRVTIGVSGPYAEPVEVSLAPGQHLVVLGNAGSGRTSLLRMLVRAARRNGAEVCLVDPRRTSRDLAAECARYAGSAEQATALAADLAEPRARLGAAAESPRPLWLLIDDADLLAGAGPAASLGAIAELLPFAADIGLSVVCARRASGSSRSAFDPFFGRLLELSDTGLLLSGDPSEGPVLGGLRPRPRPPGRAELVIRGEPAGEIQLAIRNCRVPPSSTPTVAAE